MPRTMCGLPGSEEQKGTERGRTLSSEPGRKGDREGRASLPCRAIHSEIKCKKTQSQYNLYLESVFLYLISAARDHAAKHVLRGLQYLPTVSCYFLRLKPARRPVLMSGPPPFFGHRRSRVRTLWTMHFWIGSKAHPLKAGVAAVLAVDLCHVRVPAVVSLSLGRCRAVSFS
eukprot:2608218-Rhodomonas_salina.1